MSKVLKQFTITEEFFAKAFVITTFIVGIDLLYSGVDSLFGKMFVTLATI